MVDGFCIGEEPDFQGIISSGLLLDIVEEGKLILPQNTKEDVCYVALEGIWLKNTSVKSAESHTLSSIGVTSHAI